MGYGQSTTTGIISALGRGEELTKGKHELIQTDAAINPGNSGGALLNMKGELIGINEAKAGQVLSNGMIVEGMGYAIPISTVRPIIDELMNKETKKKASELETSTVNTLSTANENLKKAAKEDQEARRAEKAEEKKKAEKAAEKKKAEKKFTEE